MKNILRSVFILLAAFPGLLAEGQVKFTTIASSQEIGLGDYLNIEFSVENAKQIAGIDPPSFPGFSVVQGPMQSSGTTVVNGSVSQSASLSYTLLPQKAGKFTIPGATADIDGQKIHSNAVTITVTHTSHANGTSNNANTYSPNPFSQLGIPDPGASEPADVERESILRPGENMKEKIDKNLFVKVEVDKTTCYVGEPIVATYKLYSRLYAEGRVTKRPSLNGFSVYDMIDPGTDNRVREQVNGKPFLVHIIRKTQLIPLQAGHITLDPCEVENTVHFFKAQPRRKTRNSGDPFQDLFDRMNDMNAVGPEITQNVTLETKPVMITVKTLPEEGKPADFNGAVGKFTVEASLPDRSVAAQDEGTLRLVVKGSGNLPVMTAPQVQWPSGFDAFDPTAKEEIDKTVVPMKGSKTFDYLFSPHSPGNYNLPAIAFSYFDPSSGSYKRVSTQPLELEVTPATKKHKEFNQGNSTSVYDSSNGLGDFVQRHLESIFAILILSSIAIYLWRQNVRLRKKERDGTREAAGAKEPEPMPSSRHVLMPESTIPRSTMDIVVAPDPLADAKARFENGDYSGFYRDLNRAIWNAVSENLDLPASELNKYNISRRLSAKGWDDHTILSLEHVLGECEMNLYTPAYDPYNMQQLLNQAEGLLRVLVPHTPY